MNLHRIHRMLVATALAALALLALAGHAGAFNIIGVANPPNPPELPFGGALTPPSALPPAARFRHWDLREFPNCTIPYALNSAGTADSGSTGGFSAEQSACDRWGSFGPTALRLARQPNTATAACAQDGENVLWFDNNNSSGFFGAAGSWSGILGVTVVWTEAATFRITEADIVFNDRDWQWGTTGDDFTSDQTANAAPYALANPDTLLLSVDDGPTRTVVFDSTNTTVGAATMNEVGLAILNQVAGVSVFVGGGKVTVISNRTDGKGAIQIVGGPANAELGFPGARARTRSADIETVCLHEFGHFLGLHHSSNDGTEPNPIYTNAVMYAYAPSTGSKRALTQDDMNAINFLYTPDYGDAPEGPPLHYQTLVHTATPSRKLDGMQLYQPGIGAGALFGFAPVDSLKYEWLGANVDDSPFECEARVPDGDAFDDGLAMPTPLLRGQVNKVHVTIGYRNPNPSRYFPVTPQDEMYVNGYFDFNGDHQFTPADREIWWEGTPNGTVAASPNWTGTLITPGQITIDFDVIASYLAADSGFVRLRLDLGENEGRVANYNGDLAPAVGLSQFGEVEDYPFRTTDVATPALVSSFTAQPAADAVTLAWTLPQGGAGPAADVDRRADGSAEEVRVASGVVPGATGASVVDRGVQPGGAYTYRLTLHETGGDVAGPSVRVVVPAAVLALAGVHPNPAGRDGGVRFSLPHAGPARIALYSVSGRQERIVAEGLFPAGEHDVPWNGLDDAGRPLATGVYFLRLEAGGRSVVARTVVVR